jgi:hypothetical protein
MLLQYNGSPSRWKEAWGASTNNIPPLLFLIYFQNINGLQFKSNQSKLKPHLHYMKDKGISISSLAETYTNWHYKNIKKQISTTTNSIFKNFSLAFVTDNRFNPPDRSPYLPGGCLQRCTDHWTSRIIETIKDSRRMGRWTRNSG